MGNIAIKVEGVYKQYRLGMVSTGTVAHDLNRWWHKVRGKEDPYLTLTDTNDRTSKAPSEYVWALNNINFEIKEGEVLGIIGKNGAGKSTLLKLLSKVTTPTKGTIKINGRIASLLEVGTGFHPELTGRENIFLNGAILGMTKNEIRSKFDEIVDFSGVERYIDTPVKRYSSGMYVRLAFAVAAHLESNILIVDEVLAVGDAEFQRKCMGKMSEVSKNEGRTILFVSHNLTSMKALCNRGMLMEMGQIRNDGNIESVINSYLSSSAPLTSSANKSMLNEKFRNSDIIIEKIEMNSKSDFSISNEMSLDVEFDCRVSIINFNLSILFYDQNENVVFNSLSPLIDIKSGKHIFKMIIPPHFLNDITYKPRIIFVKDHKVMIDIQDSISFEGLESETRNVRWYGKFSGVIRPKLEWEINSPA